MSVRVLALLCLMFAPRLFAHGGVPPADMPGYPESVAAAPWPNRAPACTNDSGTEPCGLQQSCLFTESPQLLLPGENVYGPGEELQVPWLITIAHGVGPLKITLGHPGSLREDMLVSNYPQGNAGAGDVMVVAPLSIPADFPSGPAVLEVHHDTNNGPYIDCLDLAIQRAPMLLRDGFED